MDANVLTPVLTLVGVLASSAITFMIARNNGALAKAQLNTQAQDKIRSEFKDDINILRAEINTWRDRALKLEDELDRWKERYADMEKNYGVMELENSRLSNRVQELEDKLYGKER